ncbi:helix-turn-helix transcriptional regulator [Aquisalimonas sp. 2447]|uniref:helix-turn-helix transcriptional regulator n=1 Tax=Aquisalimonas sp. 2447 TaxID=2740807 RepID=UPI00143270A4|nr:helix-turn-helix transcriptional regulator [Aquisalimonas sp. 2447]QIT54757.1 helix-turn-helix transcriptional regulator [Aquisalimonas sp. 2447]
MSPESTGHPAVDSRQPGTAVEPPRFMNVHETAAYLRLNEKKIYALAGEGRLPATKATGKWLFPRDLVDQWLMESSYGGVLTDRIAVVGGCDPLLRFVSEAVTAATGDQALICYTGTGTRQGLCQLARRRADVCSIHWGPLAESHRRHAALLRSHPQHREWILVRAFAREQGLMVRPDARCDAEEAFATLERWVMRQDGSGSDRFLLDALAERGLNSAHVRARSHHTALSESEAAARVAADEADAAPGSRGAAISHGLAFIPLGWEAVDLAMTRGVYFRVLLRRILETLLEPACQERARELGGYSFGDSGHLIWAA